MEAESGAGQQQSIRERWLKLAPPPPDRGKNSYDVFISYRSSDRKWAMSLYDALKLAGWEPFLDQYELVPGTNLETSLAESLQASSSGVILWSSRTKDSEWCRKERQAMSTLASRNSSFHYIFAKLDSEELPLFAQEDLYVDCADSPEGPRGVNLLKLICGMRHVALSQEAVRLAQTVDEETNTVMIRVNGAIEAENPELLREIGTSVDAGVLASPTPVLEAARGLISMGKTPEALEVLQKASSSFPESVLAKQLTGLALRRLKRHREAIEVLSELTAAGHQDPETVGMLAAAWYVRYLETSKPIDLRRSRELYRTAFQADSKNYYTGINAASKSLFWGEPAEATRLAGLVLPLVSNASDGQDFWAACTLGEVYLLDRNIAAAAAQYQKVIDNHASKAGDLAGTREQAQTICKALQLSESDTNTVMAPFKLLDA